MTDALPARGPEDGGSDFWDYSLKVYADPATARTCLELQNQFGLDVNLLLFCLYAGHHGHALSTDDLRRLDQQVHAWRAQVVQPLRRVRSWLKSTATDAAAEALRRQVLQTELAAEHHQQRWMEHALPIAPGPRDQKLAAANLAHYVDTLERQPDAALQAALSTLCRLSTQTLERLAPGAAD